MSNPTSFAALILRQEKKIKELESELKAWKDAAMIVNVGTRKKPFKIKTPGELESFLINMISEVEELKDELYQLEKAINNI